MSPHRHDRRRRLCDCDLVRNSAAARAGSAVSRLCRRTNSTRGKVVPASSDSARARCHALLSRPPAAARGNGGNTWAAAGSRCPTSTGSGPMRILLVLPAGENVRVTSGRPEVPKRAMLRFSVLSLTTVAALTPRRHEVRIVDENVEPIDFACDVDLVGITFMTALAP